jgi:hypothetical protein
MSIALECPNCGKSLNVADDSRGSTVRCGWCGATLQTDQAVGRTAKRRSPWRFVLLLAAFALAFGGGWAAVNKVGLSWLSPSSSDLLAYAPDNTKVVIIVNWDKIEASKAYETISKEWKEVGEQLGEEVPATSLRKAGITQIMIACAEARPPHAASKLSENVVVALTTKDPITADDIKSDPTMRGPFNESSVGKYTLYEGGSYAFSVIDNSKFILATASTLRAVLQRDKKPAFSANLKAAMDKADQSRGVAIAIDSGGLASKSSFADSLARMEMEWSAVQLDVDGDLALELTVKSRSQKGANETKKVFDDLLKVMKSLQQTAPEESDLWAVPWQTSVSGSTFTGRGSLRAEPLATAIAKLRNVPVSQPQGFEIVSPTLRKPGGNQPPKKN